MMDEVADGVFRFTGACNTYLIVRGDAAIAIDPGAGDWIGELPAIGVHRLEWVLLTHAHRDQCSGVYELDRSVTRLAVPLLELHLVEDVESFWRARQVNHNYNQVDDFLSLPRSVPVDVALRDFDDFQWRDVTLRVVPAPGHTPGSIALLADLSGHRAAFVGDTLESPGRVPQIHSLQYVYGDAAGGLQLLHSLHHLMSLEPDVLYPGRGPVIDAPAEACADLTGRLRALCRQLNFGVDDMDPNAGFLRVSEHVLETYQSCCIWYVLLSDDGHALLFDVGYSAYVFIFQNRFGYRTRFLPNTLDVLTRDHGVRQIDAVLVTHYHDDHVAGVPYVQNQLGAEVWCLDRVAPILEDPTAQNMPCLMPTPLRVDRALRDRETFEWRGVRLQAHELPGQTDLHGGFSFETDDRKYFAIGDSSHIRDGTFRHGGVIFANRVCGRNYRKVAERFLEVEPEILLHGHARRRVDGVPRGDSPVSREDLLDYHRSAGELDRTLRDLVVDHADRRCRADWVRMEPYRLQLAAGDSAELSLIVENLHEETIEVEVRIVPPRGVLIEPPNATCTVAPGGEHRSAHRVRIEAAGDASPMIVCAEVVVDGRPLGWIGHSQVWTAGIAR